MPRRAALPYLLSHAPRVGAGVVCVSVVLAAFATLQSASREPVRARQGMVASADTHASRAGVDILRAGGNAVDAAVAVGFALAVTYPSAGNIGGRGFMVIRLADDRETTIDFRETAPAAAHRDMFLDGAGNPVGERGLVGPLAAGLPGTVAGLALANRKHGRLPVDPATSLRLGASDPREDGAALGY